MPYSFEKISLLELKLRDSYFVYVLSSSAPSIYTGVPLHLKSVGRTKNCCTSMKGYSIRVLPITYCLGCPLYYMCMWSHLRRGIKSPECKNISSAT